MNISPQKPHYVRKDERGLFVEALNGNIWRNISYGVMKKNSVMGNHYHKKTSVYFFIVKGLAQIDIIDVISKHIKTVKIKKNEGIILKPNYSHAVTYITDSIFIMGKSEKYDQNNRDTFEYIVPRKGYER